MNIEDMQGTINLVLAVIGGFGGTILGIVLLFNKLKVMFNSIKNSSNTLDTTNNKLEEVNELFNNTIKVIEEENKKGLSTIEEENNKTMNLLKSENLKLVNTLKEEKEFYKGIATELATKMKITQEAIKLAFTNDSKLVSSGIAREIAKLYEKEDDVKDDIQE